MKVLVVGGGGREHALCWSIAVSPLLTKLYCAPGNGGIKDVAECAAIGAEDVDGIVDFTKSHAIDFVVIGPEGPLNLGLADRLADAGIKVFGPSAEAAQLEASKGYTKDLCTEAGIPTAAYARFTDAGAAKAHVSDQGASIVVKADGLAAGKGVILAETVEEAHTAIDEIFGGAFGEAGAEVVVEAFLTGEEASFFALCDGENVLALATARDHKRVGDGDTGPNTGGMGAYSPASVMTEDLIEQTMERIIRPTVSAMAARGTPYRGVLFAGLMLTDRGPELIEYNARFGDPETQVLCMRLKDDLLTLLLATADGQLDKTSVRWHDDVALTVVMAANGYPGTYEKNTQIKGLSEAGADPAVEIFHAGTATDGDRILATGGRVLNITARGATVAEAQRAAYAAIDKIDWPDGFCRRDIGWRTEER